MRPRVKYKHDEDRDFKSRTRECNLALFIEHMMYAFTFALFFIYVFDDGFIFYGPHGFLQ